MSFWDAAPAAAALELDAQGRPEAAAPMMPGAAMLPGPVSERFYLDDATVVGLRGPVGSGKTRTHMASRIRRAVMAPASVLDGRRRYRVVFARQTYRQLWQTTIPSWFEVMPRRLGKWAGGRGDPVTHSVLLEDGHGLIEFVAEFLAFGEATSEITANMRGVQTTDLALEEADTIEPTVIAVGVGRINRHPPKEHFRGLPDAVASWGQLTATYNACEETNPIVGLFEPENAPDPKMLVARAKLLEAWEDMRAAKLVSGDFGISFHRQPGGREPGAENLMNLARGYYAQQVATMTAMGRSDEIRRLVDNELGYVRTGTPVFEREWNRRIHVSPDPLTPEPRERLILGLDQGFFGAAVVLGFRPPFHWRVYAELVHDERLFAEEFGEELAELLSREFPRWSVAEAHGDMAGDKEAAESQEAQTWNQIVGDAIGVWVAGQTEGNNRIGPRLRAIRAGLDFVHRGQPGLLIDPRCRRLIRGFEAAYCWGEEVDKAGTRTTKPRKRGVREADVMDALAHAMLSRGLPNGVTPVTGADARARARLEGDPRTGARAPEPPAPVAPWSPFDVWSGR